jgi:small-conductance mechanosensitive channel
MNKNFNFKSRITLIALLLFLILGLAACFPVAEYSTSESSPTPSLTPSRAATTPAPTEALESDTTRESEEILVIPTLAPTATPGVIYEVVNQVVDATNLYQTRFLSLSVADWINLGISLAVVILMMALISRLIIVVLMKIARRSATQYDVIYLKAIQPILRWLLNILILYFATARLQFLSPVLKQWLGQIYIAIIIVLAAICLWKLADIIRLWYQEKTAHLAERNRNDAAVSLGEVAIRAVILVVGLGLILSHFGVNISALWTAIGIGGLALSLAAQDTLANMISGLIILLDQPFRTGDRIGIQELNTWGDVVAIGLRSTRIRTLDNRLVIVPNASISNNQVVNYTYPDPRYRIQTEIGVAYGTDLRLVRQVIVDSLKGVEGIIPDMPVDVLFMEWGDSEMVLRVRWWIESYVDARRSTDRVNEQIYQALEEAGVEMPFPTMSVELTNTSQEDSPALRVERKEDE